MHPLQYAAPTRIALQWAFCFAIGSCISNVAHGAESVALFSFRDSTLPIQGADDNSLEFKPVLDRRVLVFGDEILLGKRSSFLAALLAATLQQKQPAALRRIFLCLAGAPTWQRGSEAHAEGSHAVLPLHDALGLEAPLRIPTFMIPQHCLLHAFLRELRQGRDVLHCDADSKCTASTLVWLQNSSLGADVVAAAECVVGEPPALPCQQWLSMSQQISLHNHSARPTLSQPDAMLLLSAVWFRSRSTVVNLLLRAVDLMVMGSVPHEELALNIALMSADCQWSSTGRTTSGTPVRGLCAEGLQVLLVPTPGDSSKDMARSATASSFAQGFEVLQNAWHGKWGDGSPQFTIARIHLEGTLAGFNYMFPVEDSDHEMLYKHGAIEPYISYNLIWDITSCCAGGQGHFLDIGGHIGWYALIAAALGCQVDTVEPVPWFAELLSENVWRVNDPSLGARVRLHRKLASRTSGEARTMVVPTGQLAGSASVDGTFGHGLASCGETTACVQATSVRVDDLDVREDLRSCAMKVDVEGFEPQVFSGAQGFIAARPPEVIVIELSPGFTRNWDHSGTAIQELLHFLVMSQYLPYLLHWDDVKTKEKVPYGGLDAKVYRGSLAQLEADCGFNCMVYFRRLA